MADPSARRTVAYRTQPALYPIRHATMRLDGVLGERLRAAVEAWLLPVPEANPAMLDMFRDRSPSRELVPWAGEFVGKYLIGAQQLSALTGYDRLAVTVDQVVEELLHHQQDDGYLGPFPAEERLVRHWDVWGQYHIMLALLSYHERFRSQAALQTCLQMAQLFHEFFVSAGRRMITEEDPDGEKNYAVAHALLRLHQRTGDATPRAVADWIVREWEAPPAGRYVENAISGVPIWEWPVRRWESMHDLQAIGEIALLDGNDDYRRAFEHAWWSILEGDRHNTGGITSAEAFQGNPYDPRPIETCCTVAWVALSVDMLRMTGDSRVADELELATYNGVAGAQHPSGRWWTYNTPMDGVRKASAHDIVFQARPGSPELNCCSANAPRGFGALADWAAMLSADSFVLNCYAPGRIVAMDPQGPSARIEIDSRYPVDGTVRIHVTLAAQSEFSLKLRVPAWSVNTSVSLNGRAVGDPRPGEYLSLFRKWERGDTVDLNLDMSPHFWFGERECAGKLSVYVGPVLLAFDTRWNTLPPEDIPAIDPKTLYLEPIRPEQVLSAAELARAPRPWMLLQGTAADGRSILLSDFATAGSTGTEYRTWLPSSTRGNGLPFSRDRRRWLAR